MLFEIVRLFDMHRLLSSKYWSRRPHDKCMSAILLHVFVALVRLVYENVQVLCEYTYMWIEHHLITIKIRPDLKVSDIWVPLKMFDIHYLN